MKKPSEIVLNKSEKVVDVEKFLNSHIHLIKNYQGDNERIPEMFKERLSKAYKQILKFNKDGDKN